MLYDYLNIVQSLVIQYSMIIVFLFQLFLKNLIFLIFLLARYSSHLLIVLPQTLKQNYTVFLNVAKPIR